jgi:hypothetical protein
MNACPPVLSSKIYIYKKKKKEKRKKKKKRQKRKNKKKGKNKTSLARTRKPIRAWYHRMETHREHDSATQIL